MQGKISFGGYKKRDSNETKWRFLQAMNASANGEIQPESHFDSLSDKKLHSARSPGHKLQTV